MILYRKKLISLEESLRQCSNPDDFKLKISGVSGSKAVLMPNGDSGNSAVGADGGGKETLTVFRAVGAAAREQRVAAQARGAIHGAGRELMSSFYLPRRRESNGRAREGLSRSSPLLTEGGWACPPPAAVG